MIQDLGNPFMDTSKDLYTLDTRRVMPESVVETVRTAEELGKAQYKQFLENHLNDNVNEFNDTIHRNNLQLMNHGSNKSKLKTSKIVNLNNDCSLFSRMYMSSQARDGNMVSFFEHEPGLHH